MNQLIDIYYPAGSKLRDIFLRHSESVASEALSIASKKQLTLDPDEIYQAGMLHDIGICLTNAPGIYCTGTAPYICHGILGAALIRDHGLDEKYARVAERHTGSGITADEVLAQHLPIPTADYLPETMLEKLICYADKFYSKSGDMQRKSLEQVRRSMERHGAETLRRFDELDRLLGTRD